LEAQAMPAISTKTADYAAATAQALADVEAAAQN
jgi:hypothetical protein